MKKVKFNKLFIVLILTLLVMSLLVYSSIPGSPLHRITTPVSFITNPVHSVVTGVASEVRGFFRSLTESEKIRKENENLVRENLELKQRVKDLEESGRRWEELKSALNIRDTFSDYEIIGAGVLTRELGEWFDIFRVNAGIRDGIVTDDATSFAVVDASMNLVGRVSSSDYNSSKILPILNEGSIVSGKINRPGGTTLRVRGDLILKSEGLCRVDNIADISDISVGDEIITSGLGGLYPPGIPVGKIVSIERADSRIENRVIMQVYSDYKNLTDVFILKGIYHE